MSEKPETVQKNDDAETSPGRKPYVAPVLRSWGSMKDLTMSSGSSGANDGGRRNFNNKTR
jgi:hypothetical protein